MNLCLSTNSRFRFTKRIGGDESLANQQRLHVMSIHILDEDSLINMFSLCRPCFLGEDNDDSVRVEGGREPWDRGRWWYQLAHVCQRWRILILGSASYLRLSLVCTNGTPVRNMLAHSPPLPITVDYRSKYTVTTEDEEGILLSLQQYHRVRQLRLGLPVQNLQKLLVTLDKEFPILEYLIVYSPPNDNTALVFPETLQAPHLRHLSLNGFACPILPRLQPAATSIVTLCLITRRQSAYFRPNILLQWISFMPQLETLEIGFSFPIPNRDVERQLAYTPITTHITLPNLRVFRFRGASAYLEAVLCRITTPRLERLGIRLFKQLSFSVPRLTHFMDTTENLRFDNAAISFHDTETFVGMYSGGASMAPFFVRVDCVHLDWQVSSVAQISSSLGQVLSMVEDFTLRHDVHSQSSEQHNDVDGMEWRKLLMSFGSVKTLRVDEGLIEGVSRCLRLEDGELPLELLPELQKVIYSGRGDAGDAFTPFMDARQKAGRPVTLVHDA